MSAPVDVLAVIRRHAESHRSLAESDAYSAQEAPRLEATLAAVAELIEAAVGLRFDVFELTTPELRSMFDGHKQIAAVHMETVRHLRDALARVKGVQS